MIILICEIKSGKRRGDKFSADIVNLSGAPEMGFGPSREHAVADVMAIHAAEIACMKEPERESVDLVYSMEEMEKLCLANSRKPVR